MNDAETLRHIARWVGRLANITRHGSAGLDAETLRDLATLLAKQFPAGAFTTDSLAATVDGQEWFPPFATIADRIGEWWRDHRPAVPALPAPDGYGPPLAGLDALWERRFYARRGEGFATPAERGRFLSLIRQMSPAAHDRIVGPSAPNVVDFAEVHATVVALVAAARV
jgi:hypothetical protein